MRETVCGELLIWVENQQFATHRSCARISNSPHTRAFHFLVKGESRFSTQAPMQGPTNGSSSSTKRIRLTDGVADNFDRDKVDIKITEISADKQGKAVV